MAEQIGFLGTGNMGVPIAQRLVAAGHDVRVWNRTAARAQPVVEAGATAAATPADAASPGGVVFSILADDDALEAVTFGADGILEKLGAGGVHISMSTVSVALATRMERAFAEAGAAYLCAPVFGRPPAAAAGQLAIALSGNPAAKARVTPLLEAVSRRIDDFGEAPGAGNVVKLCGNFMIGTAVETLSEACALAETNGVDRERFVDLLANTLFDCPVYKIYGEGVAKRQYDPPGFRLVLGLKDIRLVLEAAHAKGVPLPMASLARDRLIASMARGRGELDWMAIAELAREDAGLAD